MDIPINAEVECVGKLCGHISTVILNPVSDTVTHIVVKMNKTPYEAYVVPVGEIAESSANCIRLLCSLEELENMQHFTEMEYLRVPILHYSSDSYRVLPFVTPETTVVTKEYEQIPPGELAIRRGTKVNALDGHVGRVDEFLVDPSSGHITHLILREGHLWQQRDVVIPLSLIDRIEEGAIYLKATKRALGRLPEIPVHRMWE
jgi:sporulation protein YlmC with PRC-barrel domain